MEVEVLSRCSAAASININGNLEASYCPIITSINPAAVTLQIEFLLLVPSLFSTLNLSNWFSFKLLFRSNEDGLLNKPQINC